ncbi:uncharacterized protein EAF02_006332 [Botrytis sinoallii]|uniref:uncharacterized protein n=1 Tax=Botrytis sinoallii TaxID=1463999 RepID=UPI0019009D9E|nr:uncharacterized protein EAF02_006332 [Botrytis sinoallii]KAF7881644.1 hypothetical protein EAF02_006332 [Botrytis sinoallii]
MSILERFNPLGYGVGRTTHTLWRFLQFVLALTVIGLYGTDLANANKQHKYSDGKWVYAVVTGTLSALTSLLHLIPLFNLIPVLFLWDAVLFILWIALFGLFGNMYIGEKAEGDAGVQRMKNAVWVDLVNALLWAGSVAGMVLFWSREKRTRWTGRARGRSGSPGV